MRYITIFLVLILISSVAAFQLDNQLPLKKPIPININNTNITINITNPINDTNITIPINDTNTTINDTLNITLPINDTNLTINGTLNITLPINDTNLTLNITLPINDTNLTINNTNTTDLSNITGDIILNLSYLFEPQKTENLSEGTTVYFYAGNKLIASRDNSGMKYYHSDRLGSNRLITDSNGNKIGESLNLPFGQPLINNGVRYSFTGKEFDNTKLFYFGARYYDPTIGKFTSVDPVETEPAYQYVHNNPMNYVDPDGREISFPQFNFAASDATQTDFSYQINLQLSASKLYSEDGAYVNIDNSPKIWGLINQEAELIIDSLENQLPIQMAIAQGDSISYSATQYDTDRTNTNPRYEFERSIYGDPNNPPALSSFFDGKFPEATCLEFTALTAQSIQAAAANRPDLFKDSKIYIVNLRVPPIRKYVNGILHSQKEMSSHALITVETKNKDRYFITWGKVFTPNELKNYYSRGNPGDPIYTVGGFDVNHPTFKKKIQLLE